MGLAAVVLFTSVEKPIWKRLLMGLIGLTRISGMFGDVLSYLRLFALGLASASLAMVFNDLAKQVYTSVPGFKVLLALIILLIGHGMNFGLSIMSGFIHGLRLNFIEFFNWGLSDEGNSFKAFSRKELSTWNQ
jgi:V/A-type H+-transporting ATPase subunit I